MAGFAALHAHRRVLENKRSALVGVTLEAGFLIGGHLIDHPGTLAHAPGRGESPMRIVAIRALHEALVDAMLSRHLKLRANSGVAAVAELALLFGQQELGSRRVMDRVATGAGD